MTELDYRPYRIRWVAAGCALAITGISLSVAFLLRDGDTGVYFRTADQVSVGVIGLLLAGAALLLARPRVRAGADGIEVRNVLRTLRFGWDTPLGIGFPDGAPWARLELPDDEYVPVMAIQAVDRGRAIEAMRRLRALYREYAPAGRTVDQP